MNKALSRLSSVVLIGYMVLSLALPTLVEGRHALVPLLLVIITIFGENPFIITSGLLLSSLLCKAILIHIIISPYSWLINHGVPYGSSIFLTVLVTALLLALPIVLVNELFKVDKHKNNESNKR